MWVGVVGCGGVRYGVGWWYGRVEYARVQCGGVVCGDMD